MAAHPDLRSPVRGAFGLARTFTCIHDADFDTVDYGPKDGGLSPTDRKAFDSSGWKSAEWAAHAFPDDAAAPASIGT